MHACLDSSCFHFFVRCVKASIPHIVHDVGVKKGRILRNDAYCPAETLHLYVLDVLIVNEDATRGRIVEPEQKPEDGGFATARRPYDSHLLASWNCKGEITEYWTVWVISKIDIFETNGTAPECQRLRSRFVLHNDKMGVLGRCRDRYTHFHWCILGLKSEQHLHIQ